MAGWVPTQQCLHHHQSVFRQWILFLIMLWKSNRDFGWQKIFFKFKIPILSSIPWNKQNGRKEAEEPSLVQFVTNSFSKFEISFEFQLRLDIFESKYYHVYYENSLHWVIFLVANFHPTRIQSSNRRSIWRSYSIKSHYMVVTHYSPSFCHR